MSASCLTPHLNPLKGVQMREDSPYVICVDLLKCYLMSEIYVFLLMSYSDIAYYRPR